jgi:hypothetical protein
MDEDTGSPARRPAPMPCRRCPAPRDMPPHCAHPACRWGVCPACHQVTDLRRLDGRADDGPATA